MICDLVLNESCSITLVISKLIIVIPSDEGMTLVKCLIRVLLGWQPRVYNVSARQGLWPHLEMNFGRYQDRDAMACQRNRCEEWVYRHYGDEEVEGGRLREKKEEKE